MSPYSRPITMPFCFLFALAMQQVSATPADSSPPKSLFYALPPNLAEMQVTPSRIPINQTTMVTATIRIQYGYAPESVTLRRLDSAGQKTVATLATFHDDGKDGDTVAGDSVYTAQANLSPTGPAVIKLDAAATFKDGNERQALTSLWTAVQAKTHLAIHHQSWAAINGNTLTFRDQHGRTIREESDATDKAIGPQTFQSKAVVFTRQAAIVSPDQSHVGVVGTLHPAGESLRSSEENSNISGWEFRYQDVNGTLWSKTTDGEFYLPDTNSLISESGDKVLLVETGEDGVYPSFSVYDRAGNVVLHEKLALYAIEDAQISNSGQYLLFEGLPPTPKLDYTKLIVINLDNPAQRWTETYRGASVTAKQIDNNAQGGFDVWLNNRKRYSFPR